MELSDYPKTIRLGDGIELKIRPLQKADQKDAAVLKNFIKDKENNYKDMVLMIKDNRNG